MPTDMIDRLRADPGTRTFGELIQERQWALQEIYRLRALLAREDAARLRYTERSVKREQNEVDPTAVKVIAPSQFLSLAEVSKHFGLSRSTIYKMVNEGRFPRPTRLGLRSIRWKYADLVVWENTLRK